MDILSNIDWNKLSEILSYDPKSPMIFCSGLFLFLFLGVSLIYLLLQRKDTARIAFVTLFSYYFYYKSSGVYFVLLAVVSCCDYFFAGQIYHHESIKRKRVFLLGSLLVNLGLLCYFKYTNFFYQMLCPIWQGHFQPLDIFLPVGISFFTFQSMSYTIDVYRGTLKPVNRLLDYLFYVSFFPQLVAGPIVRAKDFIPQIRRPLYVSREMFGQGIFLIIAGLVKKAIISDYISVNYVERIFDNPSLYSGVENLMGVYGYTLQIYCDFSGYSDMAIGLALLLGFHFNQNFNSPYKADSVTDFWHRWHISLSTWLRDYLYISMGGNRKGKLRTYFNLIMTMLLGGLWHGASWNFIAWGGMHGLALAIHKLWRQIRGKKKGDRNHGLVRVICTITTFHFVCLCWIFFRNSSFSNSWIMISQIFCDFRPQLFMPLISSYWTVFAVMAVGYLMQYMPDRWMTYGERCMIKTPLVLQAVVVVIAIFCVIQVKSSDVVPFIYFQF
jgi:alginate O-acetyltransferase complex protein AlgI